MKDLTFTIWRLIYSRLQEERQTTGGEGDESVIQHVRTLPMWLSGGKNYLENPPSVQACKSSYFALKGAEKADFSSHFQFVLLW